MKRRWTVYSIAVVMLMTVGCTQGPTSSGASTADAATEIEASLPQLNDLLSTAPTAEELANEASVSALRHYWIHNIPFAIVFGTEERKSGVSFFLEADNTSRKRLNIRTPYRGDKALYSQLYRRTVFKDGRKGPFQLAHTQSFRSLEGEAYADAIKYGMRVVEAPHDALPFDGEMLDSFEYYVRTYAYSFDQGKWVSYSTRSAVNPIKISPLEGIWKLESPAAPDETSPEYDSYLAASLIRIDIDDTGELSVSFRDPESTSRFMSAEESQNRYNLDAATLHFNVLTREALFLGDNQLRAEYRRL